MTKDIHELIREYMPKGIKYGCPGSGACACLGICFVPTELRPAYDNPLRNIDKEK